MAGWFKGWAPNRNTCLHANEKPSSIFMEPTHTSGHITAVLGPTNTGKTHLAIERMVGHATGMIGCPLRLLAREIYEKVAGIRGANSVALITGEEKIVPRQPRYYICTTEAMPRDRIVDFVAVDEIQLAADPDRGHVFTDRILHTRGISETMFLGSSTMTSLLRKLVPGIEFISRPRFSKLSYVGQKKITRLPSRSAVVAFSAADVYMIAESLRRLRGGAAVVLGALSPRTRNAQVGMFQAGEVDYLVATDAIGMGLNLDVDHVSFAEIRKFDGQKTRALVATEVAQIAGRAGRYMQDGTFGTTSDVGSLDPEIIEAVEQHTFPSIPQIYWRNSRLDFKTLKHLFQSLEVVAPSSHLIKPRESEDLKSLRALTNDADVVARADSYEPVSLLWDVCCVPDFQKILTDEHINLLTKIYLHLSGPASFLPGDWVQKMASRLDQTEGDIDTLATRIAHIRTWNYIAHRPEWVANPTALQERTRAIENHLSDALHKLLTQRFVDRRAAVLVKKSRNPQDISVNVPLDGRVLVDGELVGQLAGLDFTPRNPQEKHQTSNVTRAIRHVLMPQVVALARTLSEDNDGAFNLTNDSGVIWRNGTVGRLVAGQSILTPKIVPITGEMLDGHMRNVVRGRLEKWVISHIGRHFAPLLKENKKRSSGPVRGITFRLLEGLGNTERKPSELLVKSLSKREKEHLAKSGVRIGALNLYMPAMLKMAPMRLRDQLWKIYTETDHTTIPSGRVSLRVMENVPQSYYSAVGYIPLGPLAVRVDILERLAAILRRRARRGPFFVDAELLSLCGAHTNDFGHVLTYLGYRPIPKKKHQKGEPGTNIDLLYFHISKRKTKRDRPKKKMNEPSSQNNGSPFRVLQSLRSQAK